MTTNYDYTLQGTNLLKNTGVVVERLYSVFRRNELNGTNYWHLHGEANQPMSINLGFEHYCGQLQNMRNYVVTGTDYVSSAVAKSPLLKRLQSKSPWSINHGLIYSLPKTSSFLAWHLILSKLIFGGYWPLGPAASFTKTKFPSPIKSTIIFPKSMLRYHNTSLIC